MSRPITSFDEMSGSARANGAGVLAVVAAHDRNALAAVARAAKEGIARPLLLGDKDKILEIAKQDRIDLGGCETEHFPGATDAALEALSLVRKGSVRAIMKGKISTAELMGIALKHGLREKGRLLTHIAVFEHKIMKRLVLMSDGGLVQHPTLEQRVGIIKNAVSVMRALGVEEPRVAALSSTEEVDERIRSSVDAAKLKEMNKPGGELEGWGIVDGPIDLLCALDPQSSALKGICGEVAGKADILHPPDIESGNLMGKAMIFFSEGVRAGGAVVGGAVPVVLLSRSSSADSKYCSILLGLSCAGIFDR